MISISQIRDKYNKQIRYVNEHKEDCEETRVAIAIGVELAEILERDFFDDVEQATYFD